MIVPPSILADNGKSVNSNSDSPVYDVYPKNSTDSNPPPLDTDIAGPIDICAIICILPPKFGGTDAAELDPWTKTADCPVVEVVVFTPKPVVAPGPVAPVAVTAPGLICFPCIAETAAANALILGAVVVDGIMFAVPAVPAIVIGLNVTV